MLYIACIVLQEVGAIAAASEAVGDATSRSAINLVFTGDDTVLGIASITPEDYTENKLRYDQEISRIKQQIERLEDADKNFYVTALYLLQLFKHGEKIFEVASHDEKRELLKLVLSNLQMKGKTVRFTPNEPFATVLKLSERSTWQGLKDDYRTYCGVI